MLRHLRSASLHYGGNYEMRSCKLYLYHAACTYFQLPVISRSASYSYVELTVAGILKELITALICTAITGKHTCPFTFFYQSLKQEI